MQYHELVDARLGGTTALLYACYLGRRDVAQAIARYRRALDVFEAAALGDVPALASILEENPAAADMLAPDGFHPLGLACFFGQAEAATLLVSRGADVALASANSSHVTPLHSAVAAGDAKIAGLLLAKGASVDTRQQGGFTALMAAARKGDAALVELLLDHGAEPGLLDESGHRAADHAAQAGHAALAERLDLLSARAAAGGDAGQDDQPAGDLKAS